MPERKRSRAGKKNRRRLVSRKEVTIRDEVSYIIRRAQERKTRIVTLGPLLFFSSATGDAWVLDPADGDALCLARDGEPLPVHVEETSTQFSIGWTSTYRIDGEHFVYTSGPGREAVIVGYPTAEILAQAARGREPKLS